MKINNISNNIKVMTIRSIPKEKINIRNNINNLEKHYKELPKTIDESYIKSLNQVILAFKKLDNIIAN